MLQQLFINYRSKILSRMWPFTWLKNKIANRSIDELVNSGLKRYEIEYDPVIGARFYGTKSSDLGFALYQRFSRHSEFEMDQELAEDICTFLKSFYSFLEKAKNSIQQDDFLRFAYISYIAWQKIAKLKSGPNEDDEKEDIDERYEEPQGKYLKISWKQEDAEKVELAKQIKSRITPDMRLQTIDIDFSEMIIIESEIEKYGYRVFLPSNALPACRKRDVSYLIRKCYSCLEDK